MKVKLLNDYAKLPTYATDGAACFDLYATTTVTIKAGKAETIGTGLAFEVPRKHVLLLFSRSGHGFNHGLRLGNAVGVVDQDYRGEVKVRIHNDSATDYTVGIGERIAQGMVLSLFRHQLEQVVSLDDTARGTGGFGSTGAT